MTTQPAVALDHRVVGQRIVAAIIDGIVIGVGFAILAGIFGDFNRHGNSGFRFHLGGGPLYLALLASLAYFAVMESQYGATLGKMAMGIKVVRLDGSPCGVPEALIRNVLRPVDAFPAFYLLGIFFVAITPKNQRIGDLAASTLVVNAATSARAFMPPPPAPSNRQSVIDAMRELAKLHEEGLLTDEEYESKRKDLAEKL
jgi:uncharacterized RDD family membrane protein YckC